MLFRFTNTERFKIFQENISLGWLCKQNSCTLPKSWESNVNAIQDAKDKILNLLFSCLVILLHMRWWQVDPSKKEKGIAFRAIIECEEELDDNEWIYLQRNSVLFLSKKQME